MTARSQVITTFVHREADTSKHSAAYKIFHYMWDIYVPHMFVYSEEYIRIAGTVVSHPDYDDRLPKQMVGGRYTIAQMAQLMNEGATIKLDRPEDAKTIYDIVALHLEDWSYHLIDQSAFGNSKVPLDDLMCMSQLADVLYGFASRYFDHSPPRGKLARKLEQIRGRYNLGLGRKYIDRTKPEEEKPAAVMPSHDQSTKAILAHGGGRNAWS